MLSFIPSSDAVLLQANLPELMALAKEAIQENLSQSNIVAELFSRFTLK
jgi:hypothetical protein